MNGKLLNIFFKILIYFSGALRPNVKKKVLDRQLSMADGVNGGIGKWLGQYFFVL